MKKIKDAIKRFLWKHFSEYIIKATKPKNIILSEQGFEVIKLKYVLQNDHDVYLHLRPELADKHVEHNIEKAKDELLKEARNFINFYREDYDETRIHFEFYLAKRK